jgi:hypothetical protein
MSQSLAQMRDRYRDAADTVLAASTAKLSMGPVTDDATRSYVGAALGEELREHDEHRSWRPKAGPAELQQLDRDRALLLNGSRPLAVIRVSAYWELRELRWMLASAAYDRESMAPACPRDRADPRGRPRRHELDRYRPASYGA